MSLKSFHLVFVTLSVLLSIGFGLRAVDAYMDGRCAGFEATAIATGSGLTALALVGYGVWFLRKLRGASFQ